MQVLAGLAEETNYDNFKSEVAHHQGKAGAAYEHSLHDVWSVMHDCRSEQNGFVKSSRACMSLETIEAEPQPTCY